jgi:intracellular sulfur oxidation DsrE/DsrF family protein
MARRHTARRIARNRNNTAPVRHFFAIVVMTFIIALTVTPAIPGDYAALDGVKHVKAVFDVTQGSPQTANIVFCAVKNVYEDENVRSLQEPPQVAVVSHGPAAKLISTDPVGFKDSDREALEAFANIIRQTEKDGVSYRCADMR